MLKKTKKLWPFLIISIGLIGITFALKYIAEILSNASDNIKAASIAAFVGIISLFLGRYLEQRRERIQKVNSEKIKVYQSFFDLFFDLLNSSKNGEMSEEKALSLAKDMQIFQKELLMWGSDEVIQSWLNFSKIFFGMASEVKDEDGNVNHNPLALMLHQTGKLIISMRSDIGYPYTSLKEHDVASMILRGDDPGNIATLAQMKDI